MKTMTIAMDTYSINTATFHPNVSAIGRIENA
jgi:hypothetical protein